MKTAYELELIFRSVDNTTLKMHRMERLMLTCLMPLHQNLVAHPPLIQKILQKGQTRFLSRQRNWTAKDISLQRILLRVHLILILDLLHKYSSIGELQAIMFLCSPYLMTLVHLFSSIYSCYYYKYVSTCSLRNCFFPGFYVHNIGVVFFPLSSSFNSNSGC